MSQGGRSPGYDEILAVYQEFGPRRALPVEERWQERFPESTAEQRAEWAKLCHRIEEAAYALAEEVLDRRMTESEAKAELARQFPQLGAEAVSHTHGQAMYFASK